MNTFMSFSPGQRKILRHCRRACGSPPRDVRLRRLRITAFTVQRVNYVLDRGSAPRDNRRDLSRCRLTRTRLQIQTPGRGMLIFRQLFDPQSSTYTYLLGDSRSREAVLIDTVFEQARRDAALVSELELRLLYTLETHIHADHVTGAWILKRRFGSRIALAQSSGAEGADRYLAHGDEIEFGGRHLR